MKWDELAQHAEELRFTPQTSTRWLSPPELIRAGVKVVISLVFADYDDKREIQGSLPATSLRLLPDDEPPEDDVWLDYMADTGDGFDATYTVSLMLGADELTVAAAERGAAPLTLPRGSMLVLGGDEVYPTASTKAYEDRTIGPLRAAMPTHPDAPMLVALPGNHDWYDGLTSWLRIFTHGRSVGGWRTSQTRSYMAIELPHRWWLVALDTQLGSYIDDPQLSYFQEVVTKHLQPGDSVILCASTPAWVKSAADPVAFDSFLWFEQNYINHRWVPGQDEAEETGASVRLWLTGDSHHYARYTERRPGETGKLDNDPARRQLVTCGLGGAFLSATHRLPEELVLPSPGSKLRERDESRPYDLAEARFPDKDLSRRMPRRLAMPWRPEWLPRRNPGMLELVGGVHLVGFMLLLFIYAGREGVSFLRLLRQPGSIGSGFLVDTMVVVLAIAVIAVALQLRRRREPPKTRAALYLVLAELMLAFGIFYAAMALPWNASWPDLLLLLTRFLFAAVVGALLGSVVLSVVVVLARGGPWLEWQMSGQAIEDLKGFLRIKMIPDGTLTIYPIAVDKVVRDWDLETLPDGHVRPVPQTPIKPRLLEAPFRVARHVAPPAPQPKD